MTGRSKMAATPLVGLISALAMGATTPALGHPYPTVAVADYVFACMAVNGQTQEALQRCSCSIDVIGSILPYDQYEEAETVMSMRQTRGGGEKMALFRETSKARGAVETLRKAQVEAEIRCF